MTKQEKINTLKKESTHNEIGEDALSPVISNRTIELEQKLDSSSIEQNYINKFDEYFAGVEDKQKEIIFISSISIIIGLIIGIVIVKNRKGE